MCMILWLSMWNLVLKESEFVEWTFFAIECRLGDYDCFVLRLAMCESDCVGKIGGIDGLAIDPNVIELVPTPEPWFPIYDPFILGENSNYEIQETCYENIISDI